MFSHKIEAVYDATLQSVKESFPQYVRELEGVAHGAGVEFHKVNWLKLTSLNLIFAKFLFFFSNSAIPTPYG